MPSSDNDNRFPDINNDASVIFGRAYVSGTSVFTQNENTGHTHGNTRSGCGSAIELSDAECSSLFDEEEDDYDCDDDDDDDLQEKQEIFPNPPSMKEDKAGVASAGWSPLLPFVSGDCHACHRNMTSPVNPSPISFQMTFDSTVLGYQQLLLELADLHSQVLSLTEKENGTTCSTTLKQPEITTRKRAPTTTALLSASVPASPTSEIIEINDNGIASVAASNEFVDGATVVPSPKPSPANPSVSPPQQQDQETRPLDPWYTRYQELCEYKSIYGHCFVPPKKPYEGLSQWVKRQRHQRKRRLRGERSTVTLVKEQELNKLDFCWDAHAAAWEHRFNELVEYKQIHGHCNVPARSASRSSDHPHAKLAVWVKSQRRQIKLWKRQDKTASITGERVARLMAIGFRWKNIQDHTNNNDTESTARISL